MSGAHARGVDHQGFIEHGRHLQDASSSAREHARLLRELSLHGCETLELMRDNARQARERAVRLELALVHRGSRRSVELLDELTQLAAERDQDRSPVPA
jgi:hypothetical protein